jgi:hypothetical protein
MESVGLLKILTFEFKKTIPFIEKVYQILNKGIATPLKVLFLSKMEKTDGN